MTKRIHTYQDLLDEKERLQSLLKVQKQAVSEDMHEIRNELKPVSSFLSLAGKLVTRNSNNLVLNAGVNTLIDLFVKKILLVRAGWLTRLAVPFLLKNFSSNLISENKDPIMKKLFSWIGKKNANGHENAYKE